MKNDEQQHSEQRQEILAEFKANDPKAWERYHTARLVRQHAALAALEAQFEAELAEAARQLAEDLEDEMFASAIQRNYTTAMLIAGYTFARASLMGQSMAMIYRPARRMRP